VRSTGLPWPDENEGYLDDHLEAEEEE
jgi:hypothetical protein